MRAKTREKVHFVGWQQEKASLFASKAIINVFLNSFELRAQQGGPRRKPGVKKFFQKMLILSVFEEVIVHHHPNTHLKLELFSRFSSL